MMAEISIPLLFTLLCEVNPLLLAIRSLVHLAWSERAICRRPVMTPASAAATMASHQAADCAPVRWLRGRW